MAVDSLTTGGDAPDFAAQIAQELVSLAQDARTLQSQLNTGDVVTAVVLPPNGLTDLISIGNLRVAAELPPTLLPGEAITVEVIGFTGDRINLHILPSANEPSAADAAAFRSAGASGRPVTAGGRPANVAGRAAPATAAGSLSQAEAAPYNSATRAAAVQSAGVTRAASNLARPAAATAAMSGRSNALTGEPARMVGAGLKSEAQAQRSLPDQLAAARRAAAAPPSGPGTPGGARTAVVGAADAGRPAAVPPTDAGRTAPAGLQNIEARLAAARATTAHSDTAPPVGPRNGAAKPVAFGKAAPQLILRPLIEQRPPLVVNSAPAAAAPSAAAASGGAPAAVAPPHAAAVFTEPAALLRALRLPVTASNLGFARLALESPEELPNALSALDRALGAGTDSHVLTLRTLAAFLARIEPGSPVLATQIAAFVDQAVVSREGKLAQLFDAHARAAATTEPAGDNDDQPAPAQQTVAFSAERIAIREAALDYDLKTQLLAVITDGREPSPQTIGSQQGELGTALGRALIALSACQLGAASALAANPDGLAFVLPLALPTGFARAHVHIGRDTPQTQNAPLDGSNFHIAFVLETQHLGTIALDLVTVGRAVKVKVQTEAPTSQRVFSSALRQLTQRLEALRYHVESAQAAVAPRIAMPTLSKPDPPARSLDRSRQVDLDA